MIETGTGLQITSTTVGDGSNEQLKMKRVYLKKIRTELRTIFSLLSLV